MTTEVPVSGGGYRVLDSNIGKSNVVPRDLFRTILVNTCDKVIDEFKPHCGSGAKYAIIDDKFSSPDKPTLSKDGINILNSISYINEVQDGIKRLLAYCASSSDKVAGDGTTSAIIISITALQKCIEAAQPGINNLIHNAPYYRLRKAYKLFEKTYNEQTAGTFSVDGIVDGIIEMVASSEDGAGVSGVINREELRKIVVYYVAYSQAFVSSHGDDELAKAVAQLFAYTTEEAWEFITYRRSIFEKEEERFKFEYTTDQFVTTARVMNQSMLNHKLGGKIEFSDATLIPMPHPILCSQLNHFKKLCDIIIEHVRERKELLIIHTGNLDGSTQKQINDLFDMLRNEGTPNTSVAILRHDPLMERLNDISVLNLIAGKIPNLPMEEFNVIENVTVSFDQFSVKINGLYDNPEDSLIHPYLGQEEHTYFTDTISSIFDAIENYKNSGPTYSKRDDVKNFHELYMKLKYTKHAVVTIGGLVHDSLSSVDVLEDALYATRSSLLKGFEYAAACGMWDKCDKMRFSIEEDKIDNTTYLIAHELRFHFQTAVERLHSIIYDVPEIDICEVPHSRVWDLYSGKVKDIQFMKKVILDKYIESLSDTSEGLCDISEEDIFVIQPTDINKTIIKRFGDLFLKIVNVDKIVVVGGVNLESKDSK